VPLSPHPHHVPRAHHGLKLAAVVMVLGSLIWVGITAPATADITGCPSAQVNAGDSVEVTVQGDHTRSVVVQVFRVEGDVSVEPGSYSLEGNNWRAAFTITAASGADPEARVTIRETDPGVVATCFINVTVIPTPTTTAATTTTTSTTTTTTTSTTTTTTTTLPPSTTTLPPSTTTLPETTTTTSTLAPTTTLSPSTTVVESTTTTLVVVAAPPPSGGGGFPVGLIAGGGGGLLAILGGLFAWRRLSPATAPEGATSGALAAARRRDHRVKSSTVSGKVPQRAPTAAPTRRVPPPAPLPGRAPGTAMASAAAVTASPLAPADVEEKFAPEPPEARTAERDTLTAAAAVAGIVQAPEDVPLVEPVTPSPQRKGSASRRIKQARRAKTPKLAKGSKAPAAPSLRQRAALKKAGAKPSKARGSRRGQSALGESLSAWSESRRVRSKIKSRRSSTASAKGKKPHQ